MPSKISYSSVYHFCHFSSEDQLDYSRDPHRGGAPTGAYPPTSEGRYPPTSIPGYTSNTSLNGPTTPYDRTDSPNPSLHSANSAQQNKNVSNQYVTIPN